MPSTLDPNALSPSLALQRLSEGNRRFLEGGVGARTFRAELAEQQQRPFAIVLGCSDSRTPVEILFDQGFGDLFVVRIAGPVVAPSVVGSIEFAAYQFGTRLVVVMGHTRCGAMSATVKAIGSGDTTGSRNIRAITDRISPHIQRDVPPGGSPQDPELLRRAMHSNVRACTDHLRHGSKLLEDLVLAGRVAIVGAEYELETGRVNFFDGVPPVEASQPRP